MLYDGSLEITAEASDKYSVPNAFTIRAAVNNNLGFQTIVVSTGPDGKADRQDWMASFKMCAADPNKVKLKTALPSGTKSSMKLSFSSGRLPVLEPEEKEEHVHHLFQMVITGGTSGSVKLVFEAPTNNSLLLWHKQMLRFKELT